MNSRGRQNVVASVLARLRNQANSSGAAFQQVLQQYAIERFLHRVSRSEHAQSMILKGALLLKTVGIPNARPTLDIDMLRRGAADEASLVSLVRDCAAIAEESDGIAFLPDSIVAEIIAKESRHKGTRVLMDACMGNVRLRVQIDFGVGDVVVPGPRVIEFPVLLGDRAIRLHAYPIESAIAEKLEAMVALGDTNSRMKDFYDVWICSRHLHFQADLLQQAIGATFANRQTPLPSRQFEALSPAFVSGHSVQWNAFVRKIGERELADAFDRVVNEIRNFVLPVMRSLTLGEQGVLHWRAGEGWTP